MASNPIKISDTTFRDAHQSLMATRLRTADMEPIAAQMDSIGFFSMEVWGGATFDATTRYLAEDPWERLRTFKKLIPNTPLSMLLRGQSLVGYRAYADDVVDAFVQRSAEAGIDIFRVFDALNDEWNLERAAQAVKNSGKHLQLTICYSVTEGGRLGGPIFNLEYYLNRARLFRDMGADSICLKDMAGLLAPYDAYEIISAIKREMDLPVQLHTHYTSGMASMTALKAIEAGVDIVDACLAPLALRTSQPAVEPLIMSLGGTDRDSGLDLNRMIEMGDYLEAMLPKYREHMESPRAAVIDAKVLSHQIPGGMASNLISQLREADALDRLNEVLKDIPRTRKELGYPPLVTPMSQMIGSQAVSNVLFGRYKMISGQVRDYAFGLYGRPPVSAEPQIVSMALKDYGRGEVPYTERPADLLEPELQGAKDAIKDISDEIDDVLTYALYPTTGMRFLRIKHGLDPMPDEMKPRSLEEIEARKKASASAPVTDVPPKSENIRQFNVYVGDQFYQVEVDPVNAGPVTVVRPATPVRPAAPVRPSPVQPAPAVRKPAASQPRPQPKAAPKPETSKPQPVAVASNDTTIVAPMPGILLRYVVKEGQSVKEGDPVLILEAMKMENTLPSPVTGTVKSLPLDHGATVARQDVLAVISS